MDELIKQVSQKTGLSQDQAKQATQVVLDYLMAKLPAPVAGQIKTVLSGGGVSGVADAAKNLGGMFGKK